MILFYKKYAYKNIEQRISEVNEKTLNGFLRSYLAIKKAQNVIAPIRDRDFLNWRIFNSPDKSKYRIFSGENFKAIILLNDHGLSHIDVLCVSDPTNKTEIRNMICSISVFAMRKRFSRVRFYTNNKEMSDYLKKTANSFVRNPILAIYAKDKGLNQKLNNINWQLELVDSDCEYIY